MALTLRLKLLIEKTKSFKQRYFNTRERKKILYYRAPFFSLLFYCYATVMDVRTARRMLRGKIRYVRTTVL